MPKLPVVSSKQVIRILQKLGFEYAPKRGKGSHVAFMKVADSKTRLINENDVLVTFIDDAASVDLPSRGIPKEQAQDLSNRLRTFVDDWDAPEMEIYDRV